MSFLLVQEAVNFFAGDDGPDNELFASLTEIALPKLEETLVEHHAGGSFHAVEIGGLGMRPLQSTFKCAGWQPKLMSFFGQAQGAQKPFTCYGVVRDKFGGRPIEVKAVMQARLASIEADSFRRGELLGHNYMLGEIMRYELYFDGKEKYWFRFGQPHRIDGADPYSAENAILRRGV